MVNGRRKGANYERHIAKLFKQWTGYEFRRTPMSGGWSHKNDDTSGDLICMEKGVDFPLHVECKCSENWNLEAIFKGHCKPFDSWYKQVTKACPEYKHPMIIFSKANSPDYVTFYHADFIDLVRVLKARESHMISIEGKIIVLLADILSLDYATEFLREG